MIDPRGARLDLPAEYDEQIGSGSATECSRRFLRRHGLSTRDSTDVSEYAIKPGDSLLVLGTLAEASGDQTGFLSFEAADLQRREQVEAMGAPIDENFSATQAQSDFDIHPPVCLRKGNKSSDFPAIPPESTTHHRRLGATVHTRNLGRPGPGTVKSWAATEVDKPVVDAKIP